MASDHWLASTGYSEEPVRAYGSTAPNTSSSSNNKIRNHKDLDIQLYDFKQNVNFKDPLISDQSPRQATAVILPYSDEKCMAKRPTSLLSNLSSDQHSAAFSETSFNQHESWFRHPKVRENWKIVLASAFLTLLGIALLLTGLVLTIAPSRGWHCFIFAFIGLLCVIPGGYHFVYIYCAALGTSGYQFENLPVFR